MVDITIDGQSYTAEEGRTIMAVAYERGVYIPAICHHPDLPPFKHTRLADRVYRGDSVFENEAIDSDELAELEGCGLCVVEVAGVDQPVRACRTKVAAGMSVTTDGEALRKFRQEKLTPIMARHPHACITCAQREGCSLEDCSSNTAKENRCCSLFHNCELRKVAEYVGVPERTPRFQHRGLPVLDTEPLYNRDFNLCIDCARCVRVCNDVRGVEALGIVHRGGRLEVGSVAPTLAASECRFCGACVEVCPTGSITDKNGAGDREQWLVPCTNKCAAGADVPGYIRAVAQGEYGKAVALIREYLPLPSTLGHICFHDCEMVCRRSQIDDPIAICALKRFAVAEGDAGVLEMASIKSERANGKKVAIVGGGPAGLSAAYFLRFQGHDVTVFEAAARAGGVPATAIPTYRLPDEVLARDVEFIEKIGVAIETDHPFATADEMTALLDDGFDALVVAVGLPTSKRIAVPGSDLTGVSWGLDFLQRVRSDQSVELGSNVVVVGGGNVAIDVAMTALRVTGGKGTVRLYCLESREEMPAHGFEVDQAEAEGIEVNTGWGPLAIGGDGCAESVRFQSCTSVFDERGKFNPRFDPTSTTEADATSVILAIGQAASDLIPDRDEAVFLAGDAAGAGKFSVVDAVASGRRAAEGVDKFLGGDGDVSLRIAAHDAPSPWIGRAEGFATMRRAAIPSADPSQRRLDFREIEGTYAETDARYEAGRCLQCDLRLGITAVQLPPERWACFERSAVDEVPSVAGVFVLAGDDKKATLIKGTENIRAALDEKLSAGTDAAWFMWEEDGMYTKRESELIQQHLNQYGEMPGVGDDDLDDLF